MADQAIVVCYFAAALKNFFVAVFCTEFQEFVRNQEACRKRWHETHTAVNHLKTSLAEKEQENVALQTKLKHARCVVYITCCATF